MPARVRTVVISFQGDFNWNDTLQHYSGRGIRRVESVSDKTYCRTLNFGGKQGILKITQSARNEVTLSVEGSVSQRIKELTPHVQRMLCIQVNLAEIHRVLNRNRHLRSILKMTPVPRIPGTCIPFEMLVQTIVGQQVTVKATTTITARIVERLGVVRDPDSTLSHYFPTAEAIAEGNLDKIGMPGRRVETLKRVADAVADGTIPDLNSPQNIPEIRHALSQIRGVGPWTVEYFALRGLGDYDSWPASDLIIRRRLLHLESETGIPVQTDLAECQPFRGFAALALWRSSNVMKPDATPPTSDRTGGRELKTDT
ncbi:DNA-3-methyladenine glycosylase family protein [Planctomicrobium sp. SH668]|uniref:DNA-3-methyladenine glycosylase family protein n=1 Tax=Planctomicrobium sp. SH668 TaxID=3448126 RepID=UPI003F5C6C55